MLKSRGRRISCVAFVLALLLDAGTCLATVYRVCVKTEKRQSCDYFDQNGNYLYTIEWCWSN